MDEPRSRLVSVLSVCEHELNALEALEDARLEPIIEHMRDFHGELTSFLESFDRVATGDAGAS